MFLFGFLQLSFCSSLNIVIPKNWPRAFSSSALSQESSHTLLTCTDALETSFLRCFPSNSYSLFSPYSCPLTLGTFPPLFFILRAVRSLPFFPSPLCGTSLCVHTWTHVYICAHMNIWVCTYVCTREQVCAYMWTWAYTFVCACRNVSIDMWTYVCIHVDICMYVEARDQLWASSLITLHLIFWDCVSHWAWNPPI